MAMRWAIVALLLASAGLAAREEKAAGDGLALVPGGARVVVSIRPADLWEGELGKEVRKALGKDANLMVDVMKKGFGVGPDGMERSTMFVMSLAPRQELGFVLKFKKKVDA